jgi:signal transduction histidine kinase
VGFLFGFIDVLHAWRQKEGAPAVLSVKQVIDVTIRTMRFSKIFRGVILAWLLAVVVIAIGPHAAAVAPYGRDTYGNCTYGSCGRHTVVQTPAGLKVAINLTDGQIIPPAGYVISITPLNGAGQSFKQADIFIDGVKVATVTPGSDGTARWEWDAAAHPGSNISIVITDQSGAVSTYSFKIVIGSAVPQPTVGASAGGSIAPAQSKPFISGLLVTTTEHAKELVRKLPAPVVYSFPYFLFILLLIEIIVLLFQTKREVRALQIAQKLAGEEREIAGMKQTLMALVSHYLRTPLTILQGGAEGLERDGVPPASVSALQAVITQLHDTIESLITTTAAAGSVVSDQPELTPSSQRRFALAAGRVALWLPVALVGLLAFGFVYLANEVSRFTTNTIGILTQVVVYSTLILVLYQVVRRWHLHRRDATAAQKILYEEQVVQSIRDSLIIQTASQLQSQVGNLGALIKNIPATAANAKFVNRGYEQLQTVTNKFIIASRLKGARSTDAYQPTSLQALYGQLGEGLQQPIADKQLKVTLPPVDPVLRVQNTSLLLLVLKSVLDNAVAYSSQSGSIELAVDVSSVPHAITITDHGTGITADKQAALFQPFFKAEGAEEFNREGMGFSLYLDKLIMAYLGGDIALESTPGELTRVLITLPQA